MKSFVLIQVIEDFLDYIHIRIYNRIAAIVILTVGFTIVPVFVFQKISTMTNSNTIYT